MKMLSEIKKDMEFNKGLSSLIEVLKNIAVSQYRSLERKLTSYVKLLNAIDEFFEFIDIRTADHPFLRPVNRQQMVVAVTSDSGLLGGLNMQVVYTALLQLEEIPGRLIVIGERGRVYAREAKVSFIAFSGIKEEERYSQAIQLRNFLIEKFEESPYGYLKVVYPRPLSFTVQKVEIVSFLPFVPSSTKREFSTITSDVIYESHPADVAEYLIFLWMGQKLYEIFGLSRLAEFAARFVHLEESSHKLEDMNKSLSREYFRIRHEIIDRDMREVYATRLLYAGSHK